MLKYISCLNTSNKVFVD